MEALLLGGRPQGVRALLAAGGAGGLLAAGCRALAGWGCAASCSSRGGGPTQQQARGAGGGPAQGQQPGNDDQRAPAQERPLAQDPAVAQARRAAAARPPAAYRRTSLCSINDPDNWWLDGAPAGSDQQYYWLGSSLGNPEYYRPPPTLRGGPRPTRPAQGFRTAQTRPNIQRVISFHSSMADPPLPIPGDGGREGQGGEEDGRQ